MGHNNDILIGKKEKKGKGDKGVGEERMEGKGRTQVKDYKQVGDKVISTGH